MKRLRGFRSTVLAATLVAAVLARPVRAQLITEFPISGSQPSHIAPGPGGMWFTEDGASRIGLITLDGRVSEFPVNHPATSIVAGHDGNLWFTSSGFVSRMTPGGAVTDFPIVANGWGITAGPDGNVWFTEVDPNGAGLPGGVAWGHLGRVTPDGQITEFRIGAWADSLVAGPDGNFWLPDWTELGGDAIERVTPSGAETRFPLPGGFNAPGDVGPSAVVVGPDGNVWFTEVRTLQIGRVTPSGGIATFNAPGGRGIASGPDGNIWFTSEAGKVGRMTTRGDFVLFDPPTPNSQPCGIAAGADGNIWFTERGAGRIGRINLGSDPDPLRLDGGRFLVTAEWQSPTGSGPGRPVSLTADAGYFWFFDPANVEVIVKVLDWCPAGGIAFFAAGLTNLNVFLTVTDTQTGLSKSYVNPQGVAFQPIQDDLSACTPSAAGGIAGTWTGTFDPADFIDCDGNTPAQASFQQNGSVVVGTLNATGNGCGFTGVTFQGTLQGSALDGTVAGDRFTDGSTAKGTLSGTSLEISLTDVCPGVLCIPGGQMHLHR